MQVNIRYGDVVIPVEKKDEPVQPKVSIQPKVVTDTTRKGIILTAPAFAATLLLPHSAHAAGIDLSPIRALENDGYLIWLGVCGIVFTPIIAYAGWNLIFGGVDPARKSKAKDVLIWGCSGLAVFAAAPWAGRAYVALVESRFPH